MICCYSGGGLLLSSWRMKPKPLWAREKRKGGRTWILELDAWFRDVFLLGHLAPAWNVYCRVETQKTGHQIRRRELRSHIRNLCSLKRRPVSQVSQTQHRRSNHDDSRTAICDAATIRSAYSRASLLSSITSHRPHISSRRRRLHFVSGHLSASHCARGASATCVNMWPRVRLQNS